MIKGILAFLVILFAFPSFCFGSRITDEFSLEITSSPESMPYGCKFSILVI